MAAWPVPKAKKSLVEYLNQVLQRFLLVSVYHLVPFPGCTVIKLNGIRSVTCIAGRGIQELHTSAAARYGEYYIIAADTHSHIVGPDPLAEL